MNDFYNRYQNVYSDQEPEATPYENYFGRNVNRPYIRAVSTHMPEPMSGNLTENSLYPLQASLATPQFNNPIQQQTQGYARGGMVKKSKKKKKEDMGNPYPSIAELIRQQGKGEDSILAHINPLEAMMLQEMGGSGTINPTTGLPQFGFFKSLGKGIRSIISPITVAPRMIAKQIGGGKRVGNEPTFSAPITGQEIVPYSQPSIDQSSNVMNSIVPYNAPQAKSSNEELYDRLFNQIQADDARLRFANYLPYRGETVAPISPSTTRAQELKSQWSKKSTPYSNKIASVLKREAQGFSPEQQQNLLNMIRRGTVSEDLAVQRLGKQFGQNYGYEPEREVKLRGKIGKDTNRNLANSENNLNNLNDQLAILEGKRNTNLVNSLYVAGRAKEGNRNALTNQLEEFGAQERNFRNLQNQAKEDAFYEESRMPIMRTLAAGRALNAIAPYVSGPNQNPSMAAIHNMQLQKIMNFHNNPYKNYPGQRVVDIDPQTRQGYDLTYNMNPKYRDRYYDERKALEKNLLTNPNVASQAYGKMSERLEPLMSNLDYLTKQQMKQEAKEISGRHRRMGTYGSGVHKAETEKSIRNILKRIHPEREGALFGVAKTQAELANEMNQNNLNKYAQLTGLGAKDFADILATHRNLVNTGNKQWANKQEAENARLQSWYNQLNHEMPFNNELANQTGKKYIMPV